MSDGMEWGCGQFDRFKQLTEPMKTGVPGVAGDIKRMKDFLEEVGADPEKKTCLCQVIIAITTVETEEEAWERVVEDFEPYDAVLTKIMDEFPDMFSE